LRKISQSPPSIVLVLLVVLLAVGLFPGGPWGETIAFVFAAVWLGFLYKRRFAVAFSAIACFVAVCLAAAFHSSLVDVFGDGLFVAVAIAIVTMRRRKPGAEIRVLMVSRHDAERAGGTETYQRNFLRSVEGSSRDLRVTLCTFDQGVDHRDYERADVYVKKGGWFFRHARANEERIVLRSAWNLVVLAMVSLDLASIAITAADERDVDVIYGVGGVIANVAAILAGIALRRPVVCHFHYDFFFARFPAPAKALVGSWLRNARAIVANTQGSIDDVRSVGYPAEYSSVVLNWVFPEDFKGEPMTRLRADPLEKIALFVGRLVPEKGIELVLRAFDDVPDGVRLVIAGDGQLHDRVGRWVRSRPRITWLGEIAPSAMSDLLATADCLVWGSIDRHALSYAAIEALAAGVPVIASTQSSNMFGPSGATLQSTLPEDVGVLCDPQERAIAEAITRVCSWDRDVVEEHCRAFVHRNYSPANFDIILREFERVTAAAEVPVPE
jgi:glycosyltransferase involved in cell wall biosynthesis